jgi:MFS family permease
VLAIFKVLSGRFAHYRFSGDLNRLWAAASLSAIAFRTLGVVYPLLALSFESSPWAVGWVVFCWTFPGVVLYLPAGVIIDRLGPRRVMLWSEGIRIIAVISIFAAGSYLTLTHLLIAAAVEGTMWTVYSLSEMSILPALAERRSDPASPSNPHARMEFSAHAAVLTGRPLGGLLLTGGWFFPYFAILFIGSFLLVSSIKEDGARPPRGPSLAADVFQGFRVVLKSRLLRAIMFSSGLTNFMVHALMVVFLARAAEFSAAAVGLALGAAGFGGVIGSAVAMFVPPTARMWLYQMWIWTGAMLLATVWHGPMTVAVAMFLSGCFGGMGNVAHRTLEAGHVEPHSRARVASASRFLGRVAISAAGPVSGFLVSLADVGTTLWIMSGVMMAFAVLITVVAERAIRRSGAEPFTVRIMVRAMVEQNPPSDPPTPANAVATVAAAPPSPDELISPHPPDPGRLREYARHA